MELIGIIVVSLVFLYLFLMVLAMAIPPLIGFDEFHIPAGLLLLAIAGGIGYGWWLLIGQNINIGYN